MTTAPYWRLRSKTADKRSRFVRFATIVMMLAVVLTAGRTPRFGDLYDCYIIIDAEVAEYKTDDFEQVDCDDVMALVARARYANTAFLPRWQINLYDDDGIRYMLYVSKSCRFVRIDSNYFKLSRRDSKRLLKLLE